MGVIFLDSTIDNVALNKYSVNKVTKLETDMRKTTLISAHQESCFHIATREMSTV